MISVQMRSWWLSLSIVKKLSLVLGVVGLLVGSQIFMLAFSIRTQSALRVLVEGEALWSKAQKNAVHHLYRFAITADEDSFEAFHLELDGPLAAVRAREELLREQPDQEVMRAGLAPLGLHPDDIDRAVSFLVRFQNVQFLRQSIAAWEMGDSALIDLVRTSEEMRTAVRNGASLTDIRVPLLRAAEINARLTEYEAEFSKSLGAASRWLEGVLFFSLIGTLVVLGGGTLVLMGAICRHIQGGLAELRTTALRISQGDLESMMPVRGMDEIGHLASAINQMSSDLQKNIRRRVKAESANQSKSTFLANVSHELRTPLGVILGYIELIKDGDVRQSDRDRYLGIVERTTKNLNRLVNDILDISKVESGHIDLRVSRFDFHQFMTEMDTMMQIRAQERGLSLRIENRGRVPPYIATDRDRLRQILTNLLSNAIKFTDTGSVSLYYWHEGQKLHFEVQDTGIGISTSDRGRLFQRFSRLNSGLDSAESTGLGLALSRGLARIMGGDIVLKESHPGKGSTFLASVRIESFQSSDLAERPTETAPDYSLLSGKRILVVDDAAENQMIVSLFLGKHGALVETGSDGAEGLEMGLGKKFDAILMDVQMPVMDGLEATRRLRRGGYRGPILAFTANAMKEDEARCRAAGCDGFIAKPIEQRSLIVAIIAHLKGDKSDKNLPRPNPEPAL